MTEASTNPDPEQRALSQILEEINLRADAVKAVVDEYALFQLANSVLDVAELAPETATIDLLEWSDEVEEGEPYDVKGHLAYDADGEELDVDLSDATVVTIRHDWVLDPLRQDPEAAGEDPNHPGQHLSLAKANAYVASFVDRWSALPENS